MMNPTTSCFSASRAKGCDDRTKEQAKKVKSHDAPGPKNRWLVPSGAPGRVAGYHWILHQVVICYTTPSLDDVTIEHIETNLY